MFSFYFSVFSFNFSVFRNKFTQQLLAAFCFVLAAKAAVHPNGSIASSPKECYTKVTQFIFGGIPLWNRSNSHCAGA
jgi:hypothetical protein